MTGRKRSFYSLVKTYHMNSKVTYTTPEGKQFKTIVPFPPKPYSWVRDYMHVNYCRDIVINDVKPTVKKKYAKFCNVPA